MKDNEFLCSMCKGIFEIGWTEKEARAEQKDNGFEHLECEMVCDDCYQILKKETNNFEGLRNDKIS